MQPAPYVPSSHLEKRPPSRAALVTCWVVDVIVAAVVFLGTLVCALFVLSAWALHPGDGPLYARFDDWAVWVAVALGFVLGVLAVSVGREGRSPGHSLAEIKTDDLAGHPAGRGRRFVRAAVPFAVALVLFPVSWLASAVAFVLVLATCLFGAERRGLAERVAGVRDYQTQLVDGAPQPAS